MKEFLYRDATDLASGERANVITVNAQTPQAADAILQRCYDQDRFQYFGKVVLTGATWTESTKTLTLTGGFTRYVLANSTRIYISGGTGATAGWYTIASRTSDNAVVLSTSIGADADGQSDIAGYIVGGRTATRIERTNDMGMTAIPDEAHNEAGTGLNRGVSPSRMIPGVTYESSITAA